MTELEKYIKYLDIKLPKNSFVDNRRIYIIYFIIQFVFMLISCPAYFTIKNSGVLKSKSIMRNIKLIYQGFKYLYIFFALVNIIIIFWFFHNRIVNNTESGLESVTFFGASTDDTKFQKSTWLPIETPDLSPNEKKYDLFGGTGGIQECYHTLYLNASTISSDNKQWTQYVNTFNNCMISIDQANASDNNGINIKSLFFEGNTINCKTIEDVNKVYIKIKKYQTRIKQAQYNNQTNLNMIIAAIGIISVISLIILGMIQFGLGDDLVDYKYAEYLRYLDKDYEYEHTA
jgi:hypothetical protein